MSYAHPQPTRAPERQSGQSTLSARAPERQSARVSCGVGTIFQCLTVFGAVLGEARRGVARCGRPWQRKDGADARLTQVHHYFEGASA